MMDLRPPPSATFRTLVSNGLTAAAAIPIGIWINLLTPHIPNQIGQAFASPDLLWGIAGLSLLGLNVLLLHRWDVDEARWRRIVEVTQSQHTLTMQTRILASYCTFLSSVLGVPVSSRVSIAREELSDQKKKEHRLYHLKGLVVENEPFPQELAYTYVRVDDPAFVVSRAYITRSPKFELLPATHVDTYGSREKNMVEPSQRWVLTAPILQLGPDGLARDELGPRGVVVFYGRTIPTVEEGSAEWERAKILCRDAAQAFMHMPLGPYPENVR